MSVTQGMKPEMKKGPGGNTGRAGEKLVDKEHTEKGEVSHLGNVFTAWYAIKMKLILSSQKYQGVEGSCN